VRPRVTGLQRRLQALRVLAGGQGGPDGPGPHRPSHAGPRGRCAATRRSGPGTDNSRAVREWTRLVDRTGLLGDGYTADVRLLGWVAARAGLDLTEVYRPEQVAAATASAATERVDVRTRGYDLTLTLPKSFSVALALAPAELRTQVNELYTQAAAGVDGRPAGGGGGHRRRPQRQLAWPGRTRPVAAPWGRCSAQGMWWPGRSPGPTWRPTGCRAVRPAPCTWPRAGPWSTPHAASYVALSRDRDSTTVVLSAEAVAGTPEELAELLQLPAGRRDAQVRQRYADALHAAGVDERSRGLLVQRWPELATQPDPDRGTPAGTGSPGALEQARQTVAALARHADRGHRRAVPEPGQPATPDQRAHDAAGPPGPLSAVLERIRGRQVERAADQREAGRGRSRRGPARPPARSQTWNAEVYMNLYSADRHAQEPAGHSRLTRPLQDV